MSRDRSETQGPGASPSRFERVATLTLAPDRLIFAVTVAACLGYVAFVFYGAMLAQTGGVWSAPLDDVFIHFDYARATARGYPFEWTEGNGYSSGNTSLLYPFVLAIGYWVGFRGLHIIVWSALIAILSLGVFFQTTARLTEPLGPWAKYLLPPVVLSVGALDWSLWSGMENAFHLGVFGLTLRAFHRLTELSAGPKTITKRAWTAGIWGALLVATRPESVVCVAAFSLTAMIVHGKRGRRRRGAFVLFCSAAPGALAVLLQAVANKLFTGEWAAAGAITKLAVNNPYMTREEMWDQYKYLLEYVLKRNTEHHFSEIYPIGYLPIVLGLLPLFVRSLRRYALVLWAQVIGWSLLVAMNGQVRWQNERYTMAAVAWLLVLAALGLAVLWRGPAQAGLRRWFFPVRVAVGLGMLGLFGYAQAPRFRDQVWFFARASRNIRDQHLVAGGILRELGAKRVLVGDAGALLYASDIAGLDLIGLGGYHDYPFARANVHGLGASLELIDHMPRVERPDVMALYPTWWGDLPSIFGTRVLAVPVFGNVICGGAEKVIYKADWSAMDGGERPRSISSRVVVTDELDIADLISEKHHDYVFPRPGMGYVGYRVLPDLRDRDRDLFDAGRFIPEGQKETATLQAPAGPARLFVRTVGERQTHVDVYVNGQKAGQINVFEGPSFVEPSMPLPAMDGGPFELTLVAGPGGFWDAHVWVVSTP